MNTGSAPNRYDYMKFPFRLWLTYGLFRWTGAVWLSEPAHLGELVRTHIIQSFIYRGAYYFTEPSEGTISFGREVNLFLSYNCLQSLLS